jgi:hypothetical protein
MDALKLQRKEVEVWAEPQASLQPGLVGVRHKITG